MTEKEMKIQNLQSCIRIVSAAKQKAKTRYKAEAEEKILIRLIADLELIAPGSVPDVSASVVTKTEQEESNHSPAPRKKVKNPGDGIQPTLF